MAATLNRQRASGSGAQGGGGGYVIENALRFNDNDSAALSRTFGTATDAEVWTFSTWMKRSNLLASGFMGFFGAATTGSKGSRMCFRDDDLEMYSDNASLSNNKRTDAKFRDPTAWMHICINTEADGTTTGTGGSASLRMWVNGEEQTSFSTDAAGGGTGHGFNSAVAHYVGRQITNGSYFDGYLAETIFIDGQRLDPTSFGEFDTNGNFVPIDPSELTFGNNGFWLDFADALDLGRDASGGFIDTFTATTSSNFTDNDAAFTIGTGTVQQDTATNAIKSVETFTGDFEYEAKYNYNGGTFGFYEISEDGTYDADAYRGGMNSMTNSFWMSPDHNNFFYGASAAAGTGTFSSPNGVVVKFQRIGSTIKIYYDGALKFTFTVTTSNEVRFVFGGNTVNEDWSNIQFIDAPAGVRGNDFTPSGLAANDQMTDTPTDDADNDIGNYCTMSPIFGLASAVYSNGNLTVDADDDSAWGTTFASSGKYYFEIKQTATHNANLIGVAQDTGFKHAKGSTYNNAGGHADNADAYCYYSHSSASQKCDQGGTITAYGGNSTASGVVLQCALDLDNGLIWFGWNDANWIDPAGAASSATVKASMEAGESTYAAFTGITGSFAPWHFNANAVSCDFYFGANGFNHTPPTGFSPWNTSALPAPAIKDSSSHVQTELYAGNATDDTAISQSGNSTFQPDHVVVKNRDTTDVWKDIDVVRGATEQLNWDHTTIETTEATGVKSFDSSGFTLGTGANGYNDNTENFLSMMWKLGGTASSNTDGDITSSVSVNSTSGLVRGTYSGSGTNNQTVGHGLGQQPDFLMVKRLDTAGDWVLIADGMGTYGDTNHRFNSRAVVGTGDNVFNDTAPGTSVFTLGDNAATNASGGSYMFWAGYSVAGFSRYGVHEGNGNADGAFVYCGFTPLIVIHELYDTASEQYLWLNDIDVNGDSRNYNNFSAGTTSSTAEASTSTINIDILSNGFKYRGAAGEFSSGSTFTMAFAEHPFGGSGVSQARAK